MILLNRPQLTAEWNKYVKLTEPTSWQLMKINWGPVNMRQTLPQLAVNTCRHHSCHLNCEGNRLNTPSGLGLSSVSISFVATVDKRQLSNDRTSRSPQPSNLWSAVSWLKEIWWWWIWFYRPQNLTTKNFVDGLNGRRVCDVTCRFPLSCSEAQNQTAMLVVLLPLAKKDIELFTDITYLQRKELQQAHAECLNDTVRPWGLIGSNNLEATKGKNGVTVR